MNRIDELTEKRRAKLEEAATVIGLATTEKRELTQEELAKTKALHSEAEVIAESIFTEQRHRDATATNVTLSRQEKRDLKKFSICRGIGLLLAGRPLDGIEGEMHQEGLKEARESGVSPSGNFTVPRIAMLGERRDMTATLQTSAAGDQGGDTVATDTQSIIGLLYARSVLRSLGARYLTGLVGNIQFPKLVSGSAGYHTAEATAPTESSPITTAITMSPNKLGTYVEISKQLLLQSNEDVEAMVRGDIATALSLAMEAGALTGSGSNNQPLGLLTAGSGVDFTSVVGGTDGAAPTWANIVGLETAVAALNADVQNLGYLTNPKVRGKLKSTSKAGTEAQFVWENGATPLNGYRAEVTTQIPSNLTKGGSSGVASAIVFGNWDDLIIGMWGGIDIMANPYIKDIEGLVRVTASVFYDTAIRRTDSFCAMKDALTV